MDVNGVPVSFSSGQNFTINAGDAIGYFTTGEIGTYTVDIYYGSCTAGQNINFTDSNTTPYCHDTNPGGGTFTINNAVITSGTTLYILATDGACL
jgi:hypothetical protein